MQYTYSRNNKPSRENKFSKRDLTDLNIESWPMTFKAAGKCSILSLMSGQEYSMADVLVPNFKSRVTGVTATIVQLTRLQQATLPIAVVGSLPAPDLPGVSIPSLFRTRRHPRIWHARRNLDLVIGLLLRKVLGLNISIVFTCSNPRYRSMSTLVMLSTVDAIVGTSSGMQDCMPKPLARVIPHGIDTKRYRPRGGKSGYRDELGLPEGFLIGCFGRVRPEKGTDIVVDAALGIADDMPEARFVIVGKTDRQHLEFREEIEARIHKAGAGNRFMFRDEIPYDDIWKWYQALDLYVAVPRWEGFGLTVLEALASGLPVVASRAGIFEEAVVPDVTGMIVDNDNPVQLGDAIRTIADGMTNHGGFADIHESLPERFVIGHEARALTELYHELLGMMAKD